MGGSGDYTRRALHWRQIGGASYVPESRPRAQTMLDTVRMIVAAITTMISRVVTVGSQ